MIIARQAQFEQYGLPDQMPGGAEGLPRLGVNTGGLKAGGLKPGGELWLTGVTTVQSPKKVIHNRFGGLNIFQTFVFCVLTRFSHEKLLNQAAFVCKKCLTYRQPSSNYDRGSYIKRLFKE